MSLHTTSQKCKFAFRNGTKLGTKLLAIAKFYSTFGLTKPVNAMIKFYT